MRKLSLLVLCCLHAATFNFLEVSSSKSRLPHGELCDRNNRCNSRAHLVCTNGTCECNKDRDMTYDKRRLKCVILAGERCGHSSMDMMEDSVSKRTSLDIECVENAKCKEDRFCGCERNFFETSSGLCEPKKGHGENCTGNLECRTDTNLMCLNGRCSCNRREAVFDRQSNQCVAKVGTSCMRYGSCVKNAECPGKRYQSSSHAGASPTPHDFCKCLPGFTTSREGVCYGDFGATCDPLSAPCHESWSCINAKCSCHFPQFQIFNTSSKECISKVNGPCLERIGDKEIKFKCEKNSECRSDEGVWECYCQQGYILSAGSQCRRAYGSQCFRNDDCDNVHDALLQCRNGICDCLDFQVYDAGSHMCRGLVGANCNSSKKENPCIDGAFCKPNRHAMKNEVDGNCRCVPPAKTSPDRKCGHGTEDIPHDLDGDDTQSLDISDEDYGSDKPGEQDERRKDNMGYMGQEERRMASDKDRDSKRSRHSSKSSSRRTSKAPLPMDESVEPNSDDSAYPPEPESEFA